MTDLQAETDDIPEAMEVPVTALRLRGRRLSPKFGLAALALLGLVILADVLIYRQQVGITLMLLFTAVGVATMLLHAPRVKRKHLLLAFGLYALAALPLVETVDWLPFLSGVTGLAILALTAGGFLPAGIERLIAVLVRFAVLAPTRLVADTALAMQSGRAGPAGRSVLRQITIWVVPVVCAGVFLWLFNDANPVLATVLANIDLSFLANLLDPVRIIWWGLMALCLWPFLQPRLLRWNKAPIQPVAATIAEPARPEGLLFGRAAILRSLIVFNALFALQTGLDIYYLWTGHALPEGTTYADYAHRGAYPLIITALLAAAFVLAAMRKGGPGEKSKVIRALVYLWIGQNIILVLSSLLRLDLYVAFYSLTELRIAAAIWMVLVAVGLVLILLRIALGRSNRWLIRANLLSLAGVLYLCSFVDFSAIIAGYNVEHSYEMSGDGVRIDIAYLGRLGPTVMPALDAFINADPKRATSDVMERAMRIQADMVASYHPVADWRGWTLRAQRLDDYMDGYSVVMERAMAPPALEPSATRE